MVEHYQNRWVRKALDSDGDGHLDGRRIFIYDGNQIVLDFQRTGSGNIQATDLRWHYLWGPAVDQILAEEAVNGGADETVQWTLTDHLNTVRDIAKYNSQTDTTTVVNHLMYDAFGKLTSEINPAVDSLFLFTARPFDPDTQLQNNLNRWYDARVGRWLSEDPIGFHAADANPYRYCGNAPTQFADPSGLSKVTVIIKQGGKVVKTLRLSVEEAIRYIRNKSKRQAGRNIFVQTATPKSIAERTSPQRKAVYHPADAKGHPGHYHPVIGESATGKPITRNTPHISDEYMGSACIIPLPVPGASQVEEIIIELSPIGDIRTIVVEGPELVAALRETLQILQAEAAREAYLRSTTGASNMFRAIDPQLPPPAQGGFPTRAGDWRKPGFWSEGG